MPIPDWIIPNAFLDNLGDDVVAVDLAGHIVGRAATREALVHAHAGESVTLLSAADFADAPVEPEPVADAPVEPEPVADAPVELEPVADEEPPVIAADDTATDAPPKKTRKKTQ